MKRVLATATLLTFVAALAACTGEIEGDQGAIETPYALGNASLRIAIVGAGPSGLTAAHELQARGYQNITVFEKEDHVGGKVSSLKIGTLSAELGAVFASPDYTLTLALANEYGIPYITYEKPRFILDEAGNKKTFQEFLLSRYSVPEIQAAVVAYAGVLQQFPQIFQDGLANLPPDLYLNFDAFAAKYHFVPVAELAKSLIVGFGYGYYENVPAAYLMKIMNMLVKVGPNGLTSPPYFVFPGGFQSLWQAVASELDVHLNANVTSIKRSNGNGPIKLTVNYFEEHEYDAVIVSAPLSAVPSFVTLSAAEKALFRKVETTRYFVTMFASPGLTGGEAVFIHGNAVPSRINHAAVWANPGGDLPVFIAYQICDKFLPAAAISAILAYDILTLGHAVFAGPLVRKEWDYFPRVNSAALASHFYEDVEALQGNKGLYYVGGTLSFETVETSARYARSLVDARFPATAIVAP